MGLGSWLDSAVTVLFPVRGLRRRIARQYCANYDRIKRQKQYARHRAAENSRMHDDWMPGVGSADYDIIDDLPNLRDRARQLERDDAYAAGAILADENNVVGTGMRPQSKVKAELIPGMTPKRAEEFQRAAELAWSRWAESEYADAGDRMTFVELQRLAERRMRVDGDIVFVVLRIPRKQEPWRPYTLTLQPVEGDRLDTPNKAEGKIRGGVEVGPRGQPLAYWIRTTHPGDSYIHRSAYEKDPTKFERYPVRDAEGRRVLYHLFDVDRPGQSRGRPPLAAVMTFVRHLGRYLEAEVYAKRMESCIGIVYKWYDSYAEDTGNYDDTDSNSDRVTDWKPGMEVFAEPGEDVSLLNPQRPGSSFEPFIVNLLRAIATGIGMPYELVARDWSRSNYSSARAGLLEARRLFRYRQRFLALHLCQPTFEHVLEEAFLRGDLPSWCDDFYAYRWAYTRTLWIPCGWEWVDPTAEVQAAKVSVDNHLSTISAELAARGYDVDEVLEENARVQKRMRELGLQSAPPAGGSPQPAPKPEAAPEDKKEEPA